MIRAVIAQIDNKLGEKKLFTTYGWEISVSFRYATPLVDELRTHRIVIA